MRISVIIGTLLSVVVGLPVAATAGLDSYFDFNENLNVASLRNYEIILDKTAGSGNSVTIGGVTYKEFIPGVDSFDGGEILIQILVSDTNFVDPPGTAHYPSGFEVTAYAVQEFDKIDGGSGRIVYKVASADPFGIVDVSKSEIAHIYYDDFSSGSAFTKNGGGTGTTAGFADMATDLLADVSNATDGSLFAAFGFGAASDGLVGGTPSLSSDSAGSSAKGGLNVKALGPGYGIIGFTGVTNKDPLDVAPPDMVSLSVEATIFLHSQHHSLVGNTAASSYWRFSSGDPWTFVATPEPGCIVALAGLFITLALSGTWRRRIRA